MTNTDNRMMTRGCTAEMIVAMRFTEQGYVVSFPLRVCAYDLLVDDGAVVHRVQVKHARKTPQRVNKLGQKKDRERWEVGLEKKTKKETRRRVATEFDVLAVVCDLDRIYVIPVNRLMSQSLSGGVLLRQLHIKEEMETGRKDSIGAGLKWTAYLNNFTFAVG